MWEGYPKQSAISPRDRRGQWIEQHTKVVTPIGTDKADEQ